METVSRTSLYLLYVLGGVLLGVGFVWSALWTFGLLGVAVFLFALSKTVSVKQSLLGGFIFWTIKSLFAISWFWSTYPIEWIELSLGWVESLVVGIYWLTVSMFLGSGGALLAGLWWWGKKYTSKATALLVFPFLWIGGEVVSAFLFSVWTLGPGSQLSTVFSFGYLGYLLGNHDLLLLLASFGGVYILSFVGAGIASGVICMFSVVTQKKAIAVTAVTLLLLVLTQNLRLEAAENHTSDPTKISVAVINTTFDGERLLQDDGEAYKKEQIYQAVMAALSFNPKYIILPEDSRFTESRFVAEAAYRRYRFANGDPEAILIDSGRVPVARGETILRATIYDGINKKGWAADKQYLVPQGEFMPYFYSSSLRLIGMSDVVAKISSEITYRPGVLASQAEFGAEVPGVLFCFESADPQGVRRLTKERNLPFIAHPISHAWFHSSKVLQEQQDVMLKIQALWSGVAIVSAGNMVEGALYTKDGQKIPPEVKAEGEAWKVGLVSFPY